VAELAARHTRTLQHGRLAGYLTSTVAALLLLGALAATDLEWSVSWESVPQSGAWLLAIALIVSGAAAAVGLHDRLSLLMASGLVGYGSAVLFLFTGAPDLAFTQFAVETVLVVVAASVLPHFRARPPRLPEARLRNGLLALAAGTGVFLLLMNLFGNVENRQLADWFAAASLPLAHGRNVVNVIIVDFRALDTLGEIAVVAFSLLAALPLLAGLRAPAASGGNRSTAEAG
jgi:multicomponent Na+:H+ antiporter subunit A